MTLPEKIYTAPYCTSWNTPAFPPRFLYAGIPLQDQAADRRFDIRTWDLATDQALVKRILLISPAPDPCQVRHITVVWDCTAAV